jgi:hypothetical protein
MWEFIMDMGDHVNVERSKATSSGFCNGNSRSVNDGRMNNPEGVTYYGPALPALGIARKTIQVP